MNDLLIEHPSGYMLIHMDNFFPCTLSKFKMVLKTIKMAWSHEEELIEQLKDYFNERLEEIELMCDSYSKDYYEYTQKRADTERLIEKRKHPNGIPLTEYEMSEAKRNLSEYKRIERESLDGLKRCRKDKEYFKKYLRQLGVKE